MPARWRTAATRVQSVAVDACWRPMVGDVAGDFHDVIDLRDGRVAIIIGDAPGYGPEAATMAERLRAELRLSFAHTDDPAAAFERIDHQLVDDPDIRIASALCVVIDPASRTLQLANAGHLPPVMVDDAGSPVLLNGRPDPLLGIPTTRQVRGRALDPDAAVFLYTDGVVERRGTPLHDAIDRLVQLCRGLSGATASAAEFARRAAEEFGPPTDDASVLAVRLLPTATPLLPTVSAAPPAVVRLYVDPSDLRTAELEAVARRLAQRLEGVLAVEIEVVDIASPNGHTEDAGVLAAPTIVRVVPRPPVRVIGWLHSPEQLARALQLPLPKEEP